MREMSDFTCERFDATVDAYLDGDLGARAAASFEAHVGACERCSEGLAHAERVAAALRRLPAQPAPVSAVAAVLATARQEAERRPRSAWSRLRPLRTRPALTALAAALIAALALFAVLDREAGRGESEIALDDPAVVRATLETKLALAHFARANRRIGRDLSEDLLRERVVRPAVRGLNRAARSEGAPATERG